MKKNNYYIVILGVIVSLTSINSAQALKAIYVPDTNDEKLALLAPEQRSEVSFINNLIKFDRKEIKIAQESLQNAKREELKQIAQDIINSKTKEIEELDSMRKQWYSAVIN